MKLQNILTIFGLLALGVKIMRYNMGWITPEHGLQFENDFKMATEYYNLPQGLLSRIAYQESNYNPNAKNKRSGAIGLMQFLPNTFKQIMPGYNIYDPKAQISAAGKYLKWLHDRTHSWTLAIAAYNWGIGNLERKGIALAPSETKKYVANVTRDTGIV